MIYFDVGSFPGVWTCSDQLKKKWRHVETRDDRHKRSSLHKRLINEGLSLVCWQKSLTQWGLLRADLLLKKSNEEFSKAAESNQKKVCSSNVSFVGLIA